jgi:hypothetical protein
MATSTITENGRVWRDDYFFPATGWWYKEHSTTVERTVGYTSEADVTTAAGLVAAARGKVVSWNRDAPGLYSLTVETDTIGTLTIYDPQPT